MLTIWDRNREGHFLRSYIDRTYSLRVVHRPSFSSLTRNRTSAVLRLCGCVSYSMADIMLRWMLPCFTSIIMSAFKADDNNVSSDASDDVIFDAEDTCPVKNGLQIYKNFYKSCVWQSFGHKQLIMCTKTNRHEQSVASVTTQGGLCKWSLCIM